MGEPWLITGEMHQSLCKIVDAHITGSAHDAGGIVEAYSNANGNNGGSVDAFVRMGNIAVISVQGVIGKHIGYYERCSGVMDVDDIERGFVDAENDDSIDGILLDISTPGGTVTGVPEVAAVVARVNESKPVVSFCDTNMCSAGYWLGAGSTAIVATGSASIGSIGVYAAWLDVSRHYEMQGMKREVAKVGKFKAAGLPGLSLTDEQRALLEARVVEIAGWFKGFVSEHRNVAAEVMEGQSFYGVEAAANGLIDSVGGRDDAIELLESLIKMK